MSFLLLNERQKQPQKLQILGKREVGLYNNKTRLQVIKIIIMM